MRQLPDDTILGYLVLSSSQRPSLPILPKSHQQIGHAGSVLFESSIENKLFAPHRSRVHELYATRGFDSEAELMELSKHLSAPDTSETDGSMADRLGTHIPEATPNPSLSVLVQRAPYVWVCVISKGIHLYMYGLSSDTSCLLVMTNIEPTSFEAHLANHLETSYFPYRFRVTLNESVVLYPQRIAARWSRWKSDTRMGTLERFAALEKMICKPRITT